MPASGWSEPHPEVVEPAPVPDVLGESVLDPGAPGVRVFAPAAVRVVIGRAQDPARELHLAAIRADRVPVHRRITGGGAVVLAPGMVVVALRLPGDVRDPARHFARVNAALVPALAGLGVAARCRGHGDLAVLADGQERKVLGASLRQDARAAYYLASLLVDDQVALMRRYLAAPSRQPDYRGGREHGEFCTHLGRWGVDTQALIIAVTGACARAAMAGWPDPPQACPVPA